MPWSSIVDMIINWRSVLAHVLKLRITCRFNTIVQRIRSRVNDFIQKNKTHLTKKKFNPFLSFEFWYLLNLSRERKWNVNSEGEKKGEKTYEKNIRWIITERVRLNHFFITTPTSLPTKRTWWSVSSSERLLDVGSCSI